MPLTSGLRYGFEIDFLSHQRFVTEEETANRHCSFEMIAGSDVIFKFVHIAAAVAVPYFVW